MTQRQKDELADAMGLLIRDANDPALRESALVRLGRVVFNIEDDAYQRGWAARQARLVEDLTEVSDNWQSAKDYPPGV